MRLEKESRPAGNQAAKKSITGQGEGYTDSIAPAMDTMLDRASAIVVLVEDRSGRYRRRLYLSLRSAERAVERAQARGADYRLILCRISPLEGGDEL